MTGQTRAQQLGIESGDTVWVIGHSDEENALLDPIDVDIDVVTDERDDRIDLDEGDDRRDDTAESFEPTAAIVVVDDAVSLADDLDEALPRGSGVDLVWIAVPLRSRGVDPAEVESAVDDYGWSVVDRVDLDDLWTAIRVELA